MLQNTIPSYLYQEYADDEDLQAFVAAYNAATQVYVDWFYGANLAYYPGLTGPLLDWVLNGVYGLPRNALQSQTAPALGPLNSITLNAPGYPLNTYTPPAFVYYALSDDLYQRVMTWNFFKGDGKRFNMLWLKRRIMRFLNGVNGIDPEPQNPGFVVGAENTSPISVVVTNTAGILTLTVGINQTLLSALNPNLTPNIVTLFTLAFLSGVLELPVQYKYAVQTVAPLVVTIAPSVINQFGTTSAQTTIQAVSSVSGGGGPIVSYVWTWQSGGVGITINSPSSANTSFTSTGLTVFEERSGVALLTITDSMGRVAVGSVSVTIANLVGSLNTFALNELLINTVP